MLEEYSAQICNLAIKSNHEEICDNALLPKKFQIDNEINSMSLFYENSK